MLIVSPMMIVLRPTRPSVLTSAACAATRIITRVARYFARFVALSMVRWHALNASKMTIARMAIYLSASMAAAKPAALVSRMTVRAGRNVPRVSVKPLRRV